MICHDRFKADAGREFHFVPKMLAREKATENHSLSLVHLLFASKIKGMSIDTAGTHSLADPQTEE